MDAEPSLTPLDKPADGVPRVLTTHEELTSLCDAIAGGTGPIAWDAERASGYRYSQRAYLIQGRRVGVGSFLIDPIELPDLSCLADAAGDAEWVLHAASQDLPCMREVGLVPHGELFDTELGGRLAGFSRVSLAAMVAECLGLALAKEHSAADWSTRPLPEPWLLYAALDVEVLVALRDNVAERLEAQGKSEWARQEFAHVRDAAPPSPRIDPWRRTSGNHAIRRPRQQAMLRELWTSRNELAQERDIAPGRILPDKAVVAAIKANPKTVEDLVDLPVFGGPKQKKLADRWFEALQRGRATPKEDLPSPRTTSTGPPAPKTWKDRNPDAAKRLAQAREAVTALSQEHHVPIENLMQPEAMRRWCWDPASTDDLAGASEQLAELSVRPWQVQVAGSAIIAAWNTPDDTDNQDTDSDAH